MIFRSSPAKNIAFTAPLGVSTVPFRCGVYPCRSTTRTANTA